MVEHENDWDTFVLYLTYAYFVKIHQTTKLPSFSLEITGLRHGPTATGQSIVPDVRKIDTPIAYRLLFFHRAALLKQMADTNSKKAEARYKKEYGKHARFEPLFSADNYVLLKHPPLTASDADLMVFEGYSRLQPRGTGLYRVISAELVYAINDQDGIQYTVSINRLTRADGEGRLKMEVKSDSRTTGAPILCRRHLSKWKKLLCCGVRRRTREQIYRGTLHCRMI